MFQCLSNFMIEPIVIILIILGLCFYFTFFRKSSNGNNVKNENCSQSSTKPCILTKEQTAGMLTNEVVKIYEPALIAPNVVIPLKEPQEISFPLSENEIKELKKNLRYVWCDGYEAKDWTFRNCKYLGIRISDSFILHETLCHAEWEYGVSLFRQKCHARLLFCDELRLLDLVWDEVSAMRVVAEDTPLPYDAKVFWVQECKDDACKDWADRNGKYYSRPSEGCATLLFAVMN